jgi:HAD superfamily hydrolase (TIGR01509 family)
MKPELIIFDCDGTLADSENMHQLAVIYALEACGVHGYDISFCTNNFVGRGMKFVQQMVEEREGRKLPAEFLDIYIAKCADLMNSGMQPLPHALESIEILSKIYKVCVASNGEADTVISTVKSIGAMDFFGTNHVFTKNQVARGKPAPDLFLFAADKMRVDPSKSIVIEDSMTGVQAGLAAGMMTIGITCASHDPSFTNENMTKLGVKHIYHSWPEIVAFIKGL